MHLVLRNQTKHTDLQKIFFLWKSEKNTVEYLLHNISSMKKNQPVFAIDLHKQITD